MATLQLQTLKEAIDRCRAAHPTSPPEHAMHPEENRMAGLFCRMLLERVSSVDSQQVQPDVLALIEKWSALPGQAAAQSEG